MNLQDVIAGLLIIVVVLISLSVHEYAHAVIANIFGDPTAKLEGRQTINPLAHWDPIGTTLLVVLLALRTFGLPVPVFGWGKPVPINERNFDNPRTQGLQVALAGPISNLFLAVIFAMLARVSTSIPLLADLFVSGVFLNLFLMFFNLIPVPPLDGSRILRLFVSERLYYALAVNPLIFFVIIFLFFGYIFNFIDSWSQFLASRLLGI
jgi:Zn-dependent protease